MSCQEIVPCPDIKDIIQDEKTACFRITWNYNIFASFGELQAKKQINIWTRHDYPKFLIWKQRYSVICDLDWAAYHLVDGQIEPLAMNSAGTDKLQIIGDTIHFNGGFLLFDDPGIMGPLEHLQLPLEDSLVSISESPCEDYSYTPDGAALEGRDLLNASTSITNPRLMERLSTSELTERQLTEVVSYTEAVELVLPPIPFGRNIHLEAEFEEDTIAGDAEQDVFHPLFFFPQGNLPGTINDLHSADFQQSLNRLGSVFLAIGDEAAPEDAFQLYWSISNHPIISYPFELGKADMMHSISVSQDSDWVTKLAAEMEEQPAAEDAAATDSPVSDTGPYFEMLLDSIGLGTDARQYKALGISLSRTATANLAPIMDVTADHVFDQRERKFFVGFAPAEPDAFLKGWKNKLFHGKIRRIFFDPNSSCVSC